MNNSWESCDDLCRSSGCGWRSRPWRQVLLNIMWNTYLFSSPANCCLAHVGSVSLSETWSSSSVFLKRSPSRWSYTDWLFWLFIHKYWKQLLILLAWLLSWSLVNPPGLGGTITGLVLGMVANQRTSFQQVISPLWRLFKLKECFTLFLESTWFYTLGILNTTG